MKQYKLTVLVFLLIMVQRILSQTDLHQIVPETFGLMTMTYARGGDNSQFENYLQRYASMECPLITQINIVWNNEKTPEQMGVFKNSQRWKRPINFYITPHNSLNWRYTIPKESKARVYFSIDDDITISCQEFTKGFRVWQANAVGQIGPIIAYESRYFEYTNEQGFKYKLNPRQFYNFGLVGFAFVSRHFMQLYYADIWQLSQMRKVVTQNFNCEDIAIEWLAEYFYPEFQTILIKGTFQNAEPKIGVSTSSSHAAKRNNCVNKFSHIFGATVLQNKPLVDKYPGFHRWTFPFRNTSVLLKKDYLEREVIYKDRKNSEIKYLLKPDQQLDSVQAKNDEQRLKAELINLQLQLANSNLSETKLILKNKQLQEQIAGYKQLLNQKKIAESQTQTQIKAFGPISDQSQSTISQRQKQILIYTLLGFIGIVTLILIWFRMAQLRQESPSSVQTITVPLPNPYEPIDILIAPSSSSHRRNLQ